MKKLSLIIGLLFVWAIGFSQSLSLERFGTYFKATNATIEWNIKSKAIPSQIGVYEISSNKFSTKEIAAMVKLCGFSMTNKYFDNTNGIGFELPDKSKQLNTYYPWGMADFTTKEIQHNPEYLVQDVPSAEDARKRTLKFLDEMGIKKKDIEKNRTNSSPRLMVLPSTIIYYVNYKERTNRYQVKVVFKRAIDGITINGLDNGGDGIITFGDHGTVTQFRMTWPHLIRLGSTNSPSPEQIMNSIRQGKAAYGFRLMNENPIDWNSVKEIKIYKEQVFYWSGETDTRLKQFKPVIWLSATVVLPDNLSMDFTIYTQFNP